MVSDEGPSLEMSVSLSNIFLLSTQPLVCFYLIYNGLRTTPFILQLHIHIHVSIHMCSLLVVLRIK